MRVGAYRRLLRLLPRPFRERYEPEMVELFCQALAAQPGRLGGFRVWLVGAWDVVVQAVRLRLAGRRRRSRRRVMDLEVGMLDLRLALRSLARSPAYTLVAVVVLALGIGANTAIFTLVDAALLRPASGVRDADRLVDVFTSDYSGPRFGASSYLDVLDFRRGAAALEDLLVYSPMTVSLGGEDGMARVFLAEGVSSNYFALLGVELPLGRSFLPEEGDPASGRGVVVLSHDYWSRELGSDPDVLGRTLRLSGQVVVVVGVAPKGFGGSLPLVEPSFYLPLSTTALMTGREGFERRGHRGYFSRGRLAPGATVDEAQAQLDLVAARLHAAHPESWTDVRDERRKVTVAPSQVIPMPQMRGAAWSFAGILMTVVAVVLLIACANVANLTLARATRRGRELAIRLALGSGRGRLVRQLLLESGLVGAGGGLLGAGLALLVVRSTRALLPSFGVEVALDLSPAPRVYLFVTLVTLVSVVAVGLLPALRSSRPDLSGALQDGPNAFRQGFRWYRPRHLLVMAQVSGSLVLLVGAGLLVRSLQEASSVDPGFRYRGVATLSVDLEPEGYDAEGGVALLDELSRRVGALPGVEAVAVADRLPLTGGGRRRSVSIPGYTPGEGEEMEFDDFRVGPGFFATLGMPLEVGRELTSADSSLASPVVIVNRSFAERFWPGEDPLGKLVQWSADGPAEVVGVVADARYRQLHEEPRLAYFVPLAQAPTVRLTLVARAADDSSRSAAALLPLLRDEARALDEDLLLRTLRTYETALAALLAPQRAASWVLSAAGGLGMLLAAVGLYGVMAYLVAQRTRELGVRIALGARGGDVIRMIVVRGLGLAAVGVVVGAGAALLVSRFLASLLLGLSPLDPAVYLLMTAVVLAVAALASFVPARRAARVDPAVTLRQG